MRAILDNTDAVGRATLYLGVVRECAETCPTLTILTVEEIRLRAGLREYSLCDVGTSLKELQVLERRAEEAYTHG